MCGGGNAVHVFAAQLGSRPDDFTVRVFAPLGDEAARLAPATSNGILQSFRGAETRGTVAAVSANAADVAPTADLILLPGKPSKATTSCLCASTALLLTTKHHQCRHLRITIWSARLRRTSSRAHGSSHCLVKVALI